MIKQLFIIFILAGFYLPSKSQIWKDIYFLGSFESNSAIYINDDKLGFNQPESPFSTNNYLKLTLGYKFFEIGLQYENYLPPLLGYSKKLEGHRLAQRFLKFNNAKNYVVLGNFYEQFGSGLILRTFEDRQLGINTAFDGIKYTWSPNNFFTIRALTAKQLGYKKNGTSVLAGSSIQFNFSEIFFSDKELNLKSELNWISKIRRKQEEVWIDKDPKMVNSFSGVINFSYKNLDLLTELALKTHDPSQTNGIDDKWGKALVVNPSYSTKGLGININLRHLKRMDFRSENILSDQFYMLNYIPANTKQHKYSLANLHPYAAQPGHEVSTQFDFYFLVPKKTKIGGQYGTKVAFNYSKQFASPVTLGNKVSDLLSSANMVYRDFNLEVDKKWSRKLKTIFSYIGLNMENNFFVSDYEAQIANILIADIQYRIKTRNTLRIEFQHLSAEENEKNWYAWNAEYSVAPRFSFFVSDMTNYSGNKLHYPNGGLRVNIKSTSIILNYGKNREGFKCSGGICRWMPAYTGFGFTLTSNF